MHMKTEYSYIINPITFKLSSIHKQIVKIASKLPEIPNLDDIIYVNNQIIYFVLSKQGSRGLIH